MRESTHADAQGCSAHALQPKQISGHIHEQMVRVSHTYELDRSEEGIA